MSDRTDTLGPLATTTLLAYSKTVADNVSNNNGLLRKLKERGGRSYRLQNGGEAIAEAISHSDRKAQSFVGAAALDTSDRSNFVSAIYNWREYQEPVIMTDRERLQNSGRAQIHDLLKQKIRQAEDVLKNTISEGVYSDGSSPTGIDGLQLVIASSPATGKVGNLDRATNTFWRNQVVGGVTAGGSSNILSKMNELYRKTSRGSDMVDLIVADDAFYDTFWGELQDQKRYVDSDNAMAGFKGIRFQGATVIYDGGIGGETPSNTMFFINTKYLHIVAGADWNFVPSKEIPATQNAATIQRMNWKGNLTCSGAQFQGRLTA